MTVPNMSGDNESIEIECIACEDTGYEAGMPGYYCTFCKKGCAVATAQMRAGKNPFDPHGIEREESDADKRAYCEPSRWEEY